MDDNGSITDEQSFDADLVAIDLLIFTSAASIDDGDYLAALDGFKQALGLARRCFGENAELKDIEQTIEDIDGLLQ